MAYKDLEKRRLKDRKWKKQWALANPELKKAADRKSGFKYKYGITAEQYEQMVLERQNLCDICHKAPSGIKYPLNVLNVDHYIDKFGNKIVRGLLCWSCNVAIGQLSHDIVRLESAVEYLRNAQDKQQSREEFDSGKEASD